MYDQALVDLAVVIRILELVLCLSMIVILGFFVRDIVLKKSSAFNSVLSFMMVCTIVMTAMESFSPNETIAYRLGLDVLPIDQNLLLIDAMVTSAMYYEFIVGEIYISYLRSSSILALRPKWEQTFLKAMVIISMILYQTSMIVYVLNFVAGVTYVAVEITGTLAALSYLSVDIYYLVQFMKIIRIGKKSDPKFEIIARNGIYQALLFVSVVIVSVTGGGLGIPSLELFLLVYVTIVAWISCALFVKMSYDMLRISVRVPNGEISMTLPSSDLKVSQQLPDNQKE